MFRNIKTLLAIAGCFALLVTSCKKYDGDSYDFSDKEKNYIRFASVAPIEFNTPEEDSLENVYYPFSMEEIAVETRVAFTEDITFEYTVTIDGQAPETHTGTLPRGSTSTSIMVGIPEDKFPDDVDVITGKIELISASGPSYGNLRLGYPKEGNQVISFEANRPVEMPD